MQVFYCFPEGKYKALTMSYDDGFAADRRLVSIFNKYGIKGTFNLNFGRMNDAPNRVAKAEVAELYKGHEVATHTAHHPTLARCPLEYVAEEIQEDRKGLESLVGYVVRGHAYPNGSYSKDVCNLFQYLGIAYGRLTINNPDFALPSNPMEWQPTCRHIDPELMKYGRYLLDFKEPKYMKLMSVWGHSYEFDNDDNWNVIEDFCELMGGKEDIWYATNIEIIDYMQILKRLQFTASCDGVFNPSAASAWLLVNGNTIIEAKAGCFTKF